MIPGSHCRTGAFTKTGLFCVITGISVVGLIALAVLRHNSHPAPLAVGQPSDSSHPNPLPASAPSSPPVRAAAAPIVTAPPRTATAAAASPPSQSAFDAFDGWLKLYSNSAANLLDGQRLAWQRRQALAQLIQTDPQRALQLAVPFELRQSLPTQIAKYLEQPIDARGNLQVLIASDFSGASTDIRRTVQIGTTNFHAYVYGRRLTERCQNNIPLHGIALDGNLALSSEPLRKISAAEADYLANQRRQPLDKICAVSGQSADANGQPVYAESGGGVLCFCGTDHFDAVNHQWTLAENGFAAAGSGVGGTGVGVSDAWTHGVKRVLYMRVNFPDDLTEPISEAAANAVMNSVNTFYTTSSYDQTALDATVAPLVTLPQKKAYYAGGVGLLLADARAATKQAGYDTANYDLDITSFTSVPGPEYSGWSGLAAVGGKALWLQVNSGGGSAGVTAHELGHNYGLFHANFWNTVTNLSMIGPGTNVEYGNPYDTMGSANAGIYQFDAPHKAALDWLTTDAVQQISSNGVYRIYPFDVPAEKRVNGRRYAAAVAKDSLRYYWLEFRQLFTSNPWNENGLLLNWSPWDSSGGTQLIDTSPGSPNIGDNFSRDDAALVIGRTFNDQPAGVHITPLMRGSTGVDPWIDVQVNVGLFASNRPPVLRLELDQTNVALGALVHFHATATDPDGDALAYAWSFDDLTFSTNNQSWISKTFTNTGEHVVRCVVSDMKGGQASANAVVTVGVASGFRVTGRVTDTNGVPLQGVLVSNGATDAADFVGGWTDSDGRYVLVSVTNLSLVAAQFGCTFSGSTSWANPLSPTNDTGGIDFVGVPLPTVNVTVDTNAVAENDSTAHFFTVTRTGDTNSDLTVNIYLAGTAVYGSDYTLDTDLSVTNSIVIPAGTNSVTFTFHSRNDSLVEGPETVTLTLVDDVFNSDNPTYALAPPAEVTITILDDDQPSKAVVSVVTPTPEISENGMDNGEFTFTRIGSAQNDLLVNYIVSGTAQAGTDFVPLAGVVLIPAGQTSATVFLQPLDDHSVESNETVTVTIAASAAYTVDAQNAATVTILDDGANTVTVFPTSQPAAEPSSSGVFTVKRDGDLSDALVVGYTVGGTAVAGVDYQPLSGSVTIPAGATSTTVSFTPLEDGFLVPDKYVTLILTNDYNYDVGTPGSASIFITQSERPTVSISAPTNIVSEQGDTFGEFKISRTTSTGDLTVYLAVSGTATPGADYLPLDNPVVIPDGATNVMLDVIPFHDLILEPTETVMLAVLPSTNYNLGSTTLATVKILDDGTSQVPGVGFCFSSSAYPENQSPGIAVALTVTSAVPVTVNYKVIGGTAPASRYSLPTGTLTISNNYVGFIPLQIVNDTTVEPPQTVQVVLFNPTNATLDAIKTHTYTILDDDSASVSVTATVPTASEIGPVPGNFRIARAGSTASNQLVNFQITGTASAPTDYAPLGTSVIIPAGSIYVDLPVIPVDDHTPELSQTVVLTLISATNGVIVSPNNATVTISDNDTNPLPIVLVTSTNQPTAVEGGANGAFVFTRLGTTDTPLTISFTVGGTAVAGIRYTALGTSVTIPAGQSSVSLPVAAIDDKIVEGEQTVIVSLTESETYRVAYPSSATVMVQDNDQRVWLDASDFAASKYGPDPGQFTFSRFGTTNTPVTISYAITGTATNGVDYAAIPNSITIPAGSLTATLSIVPQHTGVVQGPRTVTLTLLTNVAYFVGTPTNGTVTIDDDMPMLTITTIVPSVLEGSGSNGVFRLTRTGDPQYDFVAHVAIGGMATFGVDYPAFATNVYFTCGATSVDLFVTPTNEVVVEGDETVTATILPAPAYTTLAPSNAVLTIADAGTNQTPLVIITSPKSYVVFFNGTNAGLVLDATVIDATTNDVLTWSEISGPPSLVFGDTTVASTTVQFTNTGVYQLRLTADNGVLQGHADLLVFVSNDPLSATNILRWTLNDGAGTNVLDSSGYGRNGVLSGQPAWVTNGAIGGALQFFGTNDCVRQSAGSNTLNGLKAFTVALWVKPDVFTDAGFLTGNDVDTNWTFGLATRRSASCGNATDVVEATIPTSGGVVHRASASNALRVGEWQHVAVTWTNGESPKLYLNGQLDQPSVGFAATSGVLTNCPQFMVGKGAWDSVASWRGDLDDVRVFDVALSGNEILALAADAATNRAPVVDAGTNFTVQIGIPVTLVGTVSDDGLPNPPGLVTNFWTYLGTNNITITDPTGLTNDFVFADPGQYTFRLTASDGDLTSFADVTVTVIPPTQVDISADQSDAYELGPQLGDFTLTRNGDTNVLTVYLAISGTASNGVDYVTLTNVVTFAENSNSISIPVTPILDYAIEGDESVIVTILTNAAYYVGNGQATVAIHDSPYGKWSIEHFTIEQLTHPLISGPGADFDHDGIVNFAEYAFNLDPAVSNSPPPYAWDFETDTNDNQRHLTLTYTRWLPPRDVQYGVYVSTNMLNWFAGTNFVEEFSITPDANNVTETVKTRALMPYPGTNNLFMNIRVWLEQVPAP